MYDLKLRINKPNNAVMMSNNIDIGVEAQRTVFGNLCLGLADMFFMEQELTVEVADVDCVQVNLEVRYKTVKLKKDKLKKIHPSITKGGPTEIC